MRIKHGQLAGLRGKEAVFVIEYLKDFAARRAAEAAGYAPDSGYRLLEKPEIAAAIEQAVMNRLEDIGIDAEWVLFELVDNHRIARQQGNISASNTALLSIMKHVSVDAMASDKLDATVTTDEELIARIRRGRQRLKGDDEVNFL